MVLLYINKIDHIDIAKLLSITKKNIHLYKEDKLFI